MLIGGQLLFVLMASLERMELPGEVQSCPSTHTAMKRPESPALRINGHPLA